MIVDQHEQIAVSSLGWLDKGELWTLDIPSGLQSRIKISDAKYLSLHRGTDGFFSATHHFDSDRLEVTAHKFDDPGTIVSRCVISEKARRIEGDEGAWSNLPRHYVAYLIQPNGSDFTLLSIGNDAIDLQVFDWFGDEYDKGYQGICSVTEVPGSKYILVSVQRDSTLVLFDPVAGRKIGEVSLAGCRGNPELVFRQTARELWASDYGSIVRIDPSTWRIAAQRVLQEPEFIGGFSFDVAEQICVVARPFSGDVVGLALDTLEICGRAKLGGQPLDVAVLGDFRVFARDWKTGTLLSDELRRT